MITFLAQLLIARSPGMTKTYARRLVKLGLGALAVLALIGLALWWSAQQDARDERNRDIGAAEAVAQGHKTTLRQAGAANEAGNQVRDNRGNARFDECVHSATAGTRINCERFRNEPVPD